MIGELITLPLRLTGLAARFWWRTAEQAVNAASGVAGYAAGRLSPQPPPPRGSGRAAQTPEDVDTAQTPEDEDTAHEVRSVQPLPAQPPRSRSTEPERTPLTPTEPERTPLTEEPAHVSEEPELVEQLAEPGAEDGAGAELHIREPWEGYRHMTAREVTGRLSNASSAELAAVKLYESSNRGRQTILAAVARQLRSQSQLGSANGGGSQR